jgi:hypothetical protein
MMVVFVKVFVLVVKNICLFFFNCVILNREILITFASLIGVFGGG